MTPRIAIPVPTSTDPDYNAKSWHQYAEAVTRAGGIPVEIPLNATPRETADLINTCQAVLLPGSPADVNPQKYGHDPILTTGLTTRDADALTQRLYETITTTYMNHYR